MADSISMVGTTDDGGLVAASGALCAKCGMRNAQ